MQQTNTNQRTQTLIGGVTAARMDAGLINCITKDRKNIIRLPSIQAINNDVNFDSWIISDISGNCAENPITIIPFGNEKIGGNSSFVINQNFGSVELKIANLKNWYITASGDAGWKKQTFVVNYNDFQPSSDPTKNNIVIGKLPAYTSQIVAKYSLDKAFVGDVKTALDFGVNQGVEIYNLFSSSIPVTAKPIDTENKVWVCLWETGSQSGLTEPKLTNVLIGTWSDTERDLVARIKTQTDIANITEGKFTLEISYQTGMLQ